MFLGFKNPYFVWLYNPTKLKDYYYYYYYFNVKQPYDMQKTKAGNGTRFG